MLSKHPQVTRMSFRYCRANWWCPSLPDRGKNRDRRQRHIECCLEFGGVSGSSHTIHTAWVNIQRNQNTSLSSFHVESLFCRQLRQFLNLMPFPDFEYSSSPHTISEEFVVIVLGLVRVEFEPSEHRAAHSESGVT